jgi:hypothetical protein
MIRYEAAGWGGGRPPPPPPAPPTPVGVPWIGVILPS